MAAFFKIPTAPRRVPGRDTPPPVLTRVWRLDADGRLASRWQPAGR